MNSRFGFFTSRTNYQRGVAIFGLTASVLIYQNCSGGFSASDSSSQNAQSGMTLSSLQASQFLAVFPGGSPTNKLTCGIGGLDIPATTDSYTVVGKSVTSTVGITRKLGGIGTNLWLKNNATGGVIDIIEARSAGGAAWQLSTLGRDANTDRILITNQAAGNAHHGQWGFEVNVKNNNGLGQTDWAPLYFDHYHPEGDYSKSPVTQSPCDPATQDFALDDGQFNLAGWKVNGPGGTSARWVNQYSLRARTDQYWKSSQAEQALYLKRKLAMDHKLRIYLVGATGTWMKKFDATTTGAIWSDSSNGQQGLGCSETAAEGLPGCGLHSGDLSHALLVYDVDGLDVAVAIHRPDGQSFQAQLNLQTSVSSGGEGLVAFHSWFERDPLPTKSYKAGEIHSYAMVYEIGSLAELSALGFGIGPTVVNALNPVPAAPIASSSPPTVSEGFFQVPNNGVIYYSNGNDAYCAKVAWDDYINSHGNAELSNVARIEAFPSGMRDDGTCARVPQPEGFFQVRNEGNIYYSNGNDAFCRIKSWETFLSIGGAMDKSNVRQNRDGVPPHMRDDGNCS